TPVAGAKETAKQQAQLGKLRKTLAGYAAAGSSWKAQNVARVAELRTLRDGVGDPVVWDEYGFKIKAAMAHLRATQEFLRKTLRQLNQQREGPGPPPAVRDFDTVLRETENKRAGAAPARQNYVAFTAVFNRNAQEFQEAARQPRATTAERQEYRAKR